MWGDDPVLFRWEHNGAGHLSCDKCDWSPPRGFQGCSGEQLQEVFEGRLPIEADLDIMAFFARRRMNEKEAKRFEGGT